jgi:hypothetical protein
VEKFAQYFEPHAQHEVYSLLTSPVFAYKNTRWVLNLYPEGLGDAASAGYISLFIKYVSEDPETINARVELSLLNARNERVYCRDTGDHQYQTFIDFGYKQFLKVADVREQRGELLAGPGGALKVFARVEFEHTALPASLTWSNYDLLLFKENFKDLYETRYLCDIVVKVVRRKSVSSSTALTMANSTTLPVLNSSQQQQQQTLSILSSASRYKKFKPASPHDPTSNSTVGSNSNNDAYNTGSCNCGSFSNSNSLLSSSSDLNNNNSSSNEQASFNNSSGGSGGQEWCGSGECGTLEIKAHKFILASRSGKFRELLKTSLIKRGDTVTVSNCNLLSLCANSLPTKSLLGANSQPTTPSSSSTTLDKEQLLGKILRF